MLSIRLHSIPLTAMEVVLQWLLDMEVDINLEIRNSGHNLLLDAQFSADLGMWKYTQLLIRYGADVNATHVWFKNGALRSALMCSWLYPCTHALAAEVETRLIVLLEAGCDPNTKNWNGLTPSEYSEGSELQSIVWIRALARVEHRKRLHDNDDRDADLLRGAKPTAKYEALLGRIISITRNDHTLAPYRRTDICPHLSEDERKLLEQFKAGL
jgi:hypothetical protein